MVIRALELQFWCTQGEEYCGWIVMSYRVTQT